MRKLFIIAAALLASPAVVRAESPVDKTYYVYVAAESDDTVDLVRFGPGGGELVKRIPVGIFPNEIEGPHGVKVAPGGRHWFVSIAHGMPYGHVFKYTTGDDVAVADCQAGLFPATIDISPATGFLFVVNFNLHGDMEPSNVSVIDTVSMTEIAQIGHGIMPHGQRISPDGNFAYSVAMMGDELYEIDTLKLKVNRKLKLTKDDADGGGMDHSAQGNMAVAKPTWAQPHPSEPLVYVALQGVDQVVEVDLADWKIARRFHTKKGPYNIAVSPDGKTLAVTEKSNSSIGFWNLETGKERASVACSNKITHGVTITPDSRFAFVTVEGVGGEPGLVEVYDLESLERKAVVEVGKQASGIDFWKMEP